MPIITVEMWPGRTREQKAELAKAFTEAMVKIGKTTPEATHVIFVDVPKGDWAVAGKLSDDTK